MGGLVVEWRSRVDGGQPAVLMLTAAGTVENRVEGQRISADDYVPTPFHMLTPVGYRSAER